MASITIEFGKRGKKKERLVSFLICHGNTKKRIPTEIHITDSDLSSNGKKIKNTTKARMIEEMKRKLEDKLYSLSLDIAGRNDIDATYIAERLMAHLDNNLDFFNFAENWITSAKIKGIKNYCSMLNSLKSYIGKRELPFDCINYRFLKDYEDYLSNKPRAQSLYLGQIRHLFREAMKTYNTDFDTIIKNDPFIRYSVPRQQMRKGVRALSLEEFLNVYEFEGAHGSRAELARDCFVLSFCLMGMNSVDMYECSDIMDEIIRYNRAKTKDRRSDNAYIEVKVHPFIKKLIIKYNDDRRVFNFYKRYSSPTDFNRAINIGLKQVGAKVGIDGLEFYQARHTFATLSRNLMKFSKSDVDEALNHVGTFDIADVYIKKDFSIINENNFKLIDRVFNL